MKTGHKFKTVDEYFFALSGDKKHILEEIRRAIKQAAPNAKEVISYNMPALKQNGILVYYAANKGHIGFYPTSDPVRFFKNELAGYDTSKGTIKFPMGKAVDLELIAKIVKFRVQQDIEKAAFDFR